MKDGLVVALWATNLAHPTTSLAAWADLVEKKVVEAKRAGADILLTPEYAAEHWLHFAPAGTKPTEQIMWMAKHTAEAIEIMRGLAQKHQILLIPGSFPSEFTGHTPPVANRSHIFFPDGHMLVQNKLCLTPKEKNPEGWMLSTGNELGIFEYQGFRLAVFICLDIELPALSAKIAQEKIDLILVPSMTKKLAGYHRVFDCAKARAVELQAAIAVVGAIGGAPGRDPNISGASVFVPCEEKFGHTGVLAHIPPSYKADAEGPMLTVKVPLADIRAMRQGQAEVWPGAWTSEHVKIRQNG